MKFFQDCWLLVLSFFGGGNHDFDPARQKPMLDESYHFPTVNTSPKPPVHVSAGNGPRFDAPSSPVEDRFKCDYSAMGSDWQPCSTADDRGCWLKNSKTGESYNISTDYEAKWPTGTTRRYKLDIADMQINADGVTMRNGVVFNQTYPGPWIQACWGDDLEITIVNNIKKYNGSTIHWHGVRQLNTFEYDGVNGVTQCPIAPGSSFTYRFKATQYGTTWYHSHYSLQYADGLLGPMTFHGPSSADYDVSVNPTLMTDWNHRSAFEDIYIEYSGVPPPMDGILLNGIGNYAGVNPGGKKYTVAFVPKKRYLMRIINTSISTSFVFSIDNHTLEVMSSDFVPIKPYNTSAITVGIGQRYHIVVEAHDFPLGTDLAQKNFWIRVIGATGCETFPAGNEPDERQGILRYRQGSNVVPTTTRNPGINLNCRDEPYASLVPVVPWTVGPPANNYEANDTYDVGLIPPSGQPPPLYGAFPRWVIGSEPMWLNFSDPTIRHVQDSPRRFDPKAQVITQDVPKDSWVYLLISGNDTNPLVNTTRFFVPAAHPIHFHGHDFVLLQQSTTSYINSSSLHLQLDNPPRRDVTLLPAGGFIVIAFRADNPGAWLLHCHIAFHASSGLALQILERPEDVKAPLFKPGWDQPVKDGCKSWDKWFANPKNLWDQDVKDFQDDSGI